jgi:hypothetical protein
MVLFKYEMEYESYIRTVGFFLQVQKFIILKCSSY